MFSPAKLTALRKAKGWRKAELARQAHLAPGHISLLEKGHYRNPSIETVSKLAQALGCKIDDLLPAVAQPRKWARAAMSVPA